MAEQSYKYWAFISYSHQDRAWANWLHKSLETYRVPHRLVGREHWSGPLPRRLMPIFRDRDELPSSAELGSVLNEALQQSRYLIVICSPQSATSRWVNEEIKTFKSLSRAQRVLPLIIGGEPNATDKPNSGHVECLPPAIRFEVDSNGQLTECRAEPIAADARGGKDGRATAKLKLIAGLIGVGLDELRQRERQRQIQRRILTAAAAIALTLLAGLGWHWQQNEKQHALEAQALKVRIAELYENGRQELLAHNEARAAVYLNEAYKLGVDTPALRYMLARAMRVVDAQALRVQIGSPTLMVALSPDGKRFLAVGRNNQLGVWNAETGEKLGTYDLGTTAQQMAAAFSPRGSLIWVYTAHSDAPENRLRVLNSKVIRLLAEFSEGHGDTDAMPAPIDGGDRYVVYLKDNFSIAIYDLIKHSERLVPGNYSAAAFCNDHHSVLAGAADGKVYLLDRDTGEIKKLFTGLRGTVVTLDSSDNCASLTAGTSEGAVRVWNVQTGEVLMTGGHAQPISVLKLNPQGSRLVSMTSRGVNVWHTSTGALLHAENFLDPLNSLAANSSDGERLAIINNSRLSLINPLSAAELYTLDGHQGAVISFDFSASTNKFISGGADGSVVIWNLPRDTDAEFHLGMANRQRMLNPSEPPESQAHFNYKGSQIFAGGNDGVGTVWRSDSLQKAVSLKGSAAPLSAVAFSTDDKILAIGARDQSLSLWDISSGKMLRHLDRLGAYVILLSFDPSNRLLSVAVQDQGALLMTVPQGAPVERFGIDYSHAQAFSPKGGAYAVGIHGAVKLWDPSKMMYRWSTSLPFDSRGQAKVAVVKFSPDGERILATLPPNRAFILDANSGHILQQINEPSANGFYVSAFSPDGRRIALGGLGKVVMIWQLASNDVLKLLGHMADIRGVAFSPDGTELVSAGGDGTLKIWDVVHGDLLDSISAHDGAVSWDGVQFNLQGNQVLSSGTDNVVRLWNVKKESRNPEQIATLLRCRVAWRASGTMLVSVAPESQGCSTN